jgi:hypothetical protein
MAFGHIHCDALGTQLGPRYLAGARICWAPAAVAQLGKPSGLGRVAR